MAGEAGIGTRVVVAGLGVGFAVGWNITETGAVASRLAHAYGVGLATIGLLTTAQFLVHMAMQIPGGRAADRFGAWATALAGLGFVAAGNALSLIGPYIALAFVGKLIVGFGTGLGFVGGSDYIRARGGSPFLQGVYGSASVLAPGIAIAVVPALATHYGFRAPYLSGVVVAGAMALLLVLAPSSRGAARHAAEKLDRGLFRDRYLLRLSAIHAASFGFSVIVGNWVVTLLEHHGHSKRFAAVAGSLTLLLAFFSRIGGGALLRRDDASRWVALSLALGGAGAVALALPLPRGAARRRRGGDRPRERRAVPDGVRRRRARPSRRARHGGRLRQHVGRARDRRRRAARRADVLAARATVASASSSSASSPALAALSTPRWRPPQTR